MDREKQQLSIEAARLYYQSDYSQQQIAEQLQISRPTVSRLLQFAKEKGYVQIRIVDPFEDMGALGAMLEEKYGLLEAHVVFSPTEDDSTITHYLSRYGAEYMHDTVNDGDIVGVSWGMTMYQIAQHLEAKHVKGVEVVQLKGGISHSQVNTYSAETIQLFAESFQTMPRYLPLPVVFDNAEVKQMVEQDRHIKRIIEMGKQANIALFTVGTVRDEALLFRLGYFSEDEITLLQTQGVGDICSRFFDADGNICSEAIDSRTIGVELADLRQKEKSILVAGGIRKAAAIHGALKGKYANVLIIDQHTAKELLKGEED
ncbi:RNA polymerase sigma70 [Bacillus glycinifermentans]|uniref:RNA polymerase subunit sigma-70 n=1 Tax=Bacillus glycinifermentans TaxID=1664069 RepID=A0A0J6ENC4_9BACI|nr:sugar-binding transcriptional regulator [Bacillus glycinifermentans]ATH93811.1 RNA polymerase subunit sigma-70 [Bacillus glycinifermentans]KMM59397.1 RNA polymerase sigma70 [Bacillus glycinifermentans]KRT90011.1 RNA polymerase subunit sigma-70 [Bacillus glycinifermentans]MEC0483686.1 sugar-binding transcriptional regulator [Bacillus glycinifermentans]MEC0496181.1 sugar-binding transcriptional regulator [Bacillus glycinifermentans]